MVRNPKPTVKGRFGDGYDTGPWNMERVRWTNSLQKVQRNFAGMSCHEPYHQRLWGPLPSVHVSKFTLGCLLRRQTFLRCRSRDERFKFCLAQGSVRVPRSIFVRVLKIIMPHRALAYPKCTTPELRLGLLLCQSACLDFRLRVDGLRRVAVTHLDHLGSGLPQLLTVGPCVERPFSSSYSSIIITFHRSFYFKMILVGRRSPKPKS